MKSLTAGPLLLVDWDRARTVCSIVQISWWRPLSTGHSPPARTVHVHRLFSSRRPAAPPGLFGRLWEGFTSEKGAGTTRETWNVQRSAGLHLSLLLYPFPLPLLLRSSRPVTLFPVPSSVSSHRQATKTPGSAAPTLGATDIFDDWLPDQNIQTSGIIGHYGAKLQASRVQHILGASTSDELGSSRGLAVPAPIGNQGTSQLQALDLGTSVALPLNQGELPR